MSRLTMNSRLSSAAARRAPFGADSTGFVASVISARIWPGPGVSISSARQTIGNSPITSGAPRTRLRCRPSATPRPRPAGPLVFAANAAACGNIAPPGVSRWPVRMLSTSTSQLASVPNSCVQLPMRAYRLARGVPARSRASARIVSAGRPQRAATASALNGATAACTAAMPSTSAARPPGFASPSANSVCTMPASRKASAPGRMKWCVSASAAVSVRRGSMTTSRPPRACSARALPRKSGTVHMLPLLTTGLAPSTISRSARAMSGTGTLIQWPYSRPLATCRGIWSSVDAV